jgi:hypothetical protein
MVGDLHNRRNCWKVAALGRLRTVAFNLVGLECSALEADDKLIGSCSSSSSFSENGVFTGLGGSGVKEHRALSPKPQELMLPEMVWSCQGLPCCSAGADTGVMNMTLPLPCSLNQQSLYSVTLEHFLRKWLLMPPVVVLLACVNSVCSQG